MQISRRDGLRALMAAAAMVGAPSLGRAAEPEIVLGAPNSLTGGFGENGQRGVWGFLIAAEQINRQGGIKALGGAKVRVIVADTSTENPTQAASVTRRILDQDHAVALYGATTSAMTLAAQVEAEKSRVPIVTTSYADPLTKRGMKYTFKITAPGSAIWNFAMDSVVEMLTAQRGTAPKSGAIFMGPDAVSVAVSKALPKEAARIGLPVVIHVDFQGNLTDPSVVVSPILQKKPEVIFLSSFLDDAVLILRTLRGLGVKTPVVAAGGISTDSAGKTLGPAADGVFMPWSWSWDLPVPGESQLVALYKAAHKDAPYPPNNEQLGLGYAAGLILQQALEKAASRDGVKIRDVLATTEFTGLALPAKKVAFDATGLNKDAVLILTEWHKGNAHTVWPKDLQAMKPVI
ncbi:MAG TPA: ABC transporter substrate-binding protein [Stellaceae bacterium]|nr:ABC transporter substrate-binding protein [Stellaceae bacterium]